MPSNLPKVTQVIGSRAGIWASRAVLSSIAWIQTQIILLTDLKDLNKKWETRCSFKNTLRSYSC